MTLAVISRAIDAAGRTGAAVPAIPVTDTIKQVGDTGDVEATPERARLRIAQTPQAFPMSVLKQAYENALKADSTFAKAVKNADRLSAMVIDPSATPINTGEYAELFRQYIRMWRDSIPTTPEL